MAEYTEIISFKGATMNNDDAPEAIQKPQILRAFNTRFSGTSQQEAAYGSNPESNILITTSTPKGINKGIGGGSFESIGKVVIFRYNSAGNHQIVVYDRATQTEIVTYEDLTDSDGVQLLNLDPQNYIKAILVNNTFLVWATSELEVGYVNLTTLLAGGYGSVLTWEDLSLLKPQLMIPPTGIYGNDAGQSANYLYSKLPQFIVQYVGFDYNKSAWSTRSERIVPYQENTPILGQNVGLNNYITISVNIGSSRVKTVNVGAQFDDSGQFSIIKTVDTSYIIALPNNAVDVSNQIYEGYDPTTNIYQFAFYNNTVSTPIPATETDLGYDYIWPSNTLENINGNYIALADFKTLYPRPSTEVTVAGIGYNPNIGIPAGTITDPLLTNGNFPGAVGSGAGDHRRVIWIALKGTPRTNDVIVLVVANIGDATQTVNYTYTVPSAQNGNLLSVVQSIATRVGGSYVAYNGGYKITWVDQPYYQLQLFNVELYFSGATVANSVPEVLDNAPYRASIAYFDYKGRYFPLTTDNTYSVNTPSYAQQLGNATELSINILTANAPAGAVGYQVLITKPPITKVLDTIASVLSFKGAWDAYNNSPALAINAGLIGDAYQITTPSTPGTVSGSTPHYTNLGNNATYNTGDYIVNVGGSSGTAGSGQFYQVLPKNFGDIGSVGGILVFSINSLNLLNAEYSNENVRTNLSYDFAAGDRCTLHYWIDGSGVINYFNQPCIDLVVLGYDAATSLVKVENSSALTYSGGHILYNGQQIDARNIFLRLYSPQPTVQTQSETLWYETGQYYTVTNELHDVTNITVKDGGAYYKTRQFPDALMPYQNPPVSVLATDLNYSDFYVSPYHSFGRVRSYYDELEQAERKASIITSQNYIIGSKNNGLNRFYQENIYGDSDGQTSSSKGAIQILWQRGDVLLIGQELGVFYSPLNYAYTVLNEQITGQSISEKLLNNGRYDTQGIGFGMSKAFCFNKDIGFMVDPYKSEVFALTVGGIVNISGKLSQYLKPYLV